MVGEAVNGDDGGQAAKIPPIGCKVRAGVMNHLVTLVREECGGGCEKPSIRIRGGIVNVPDGGGGAAKGHHPEDHRGKGRFPSQQEAWAQQEAGQQPERQQPEGVGGQPLALTEGGGSCNKVPPHPTSSRLDKEQQALQFPSRAVNTEEGNVLVGGDVPEGFFAVVP